MYSWLDQLALFAPSLLLSSNPLMATALKVMPWTACPWAFMPNIKLFRTKISDGREGIRYRASFWICVILIWICEIFYSDLWDWLNCWGGVEAAKEGTKGPPWPGAIQQRLEHKTTIQLGNSAHSNIPNFRPFDPTSNVIGFSFCKTILIVHVFLVWYHGGWVRRSGAELNRV